MTLLNIHQYANGNHIPDNLRDALLQDHLLRNFPHMLRRPLFNINPRLVNGDLPPPPDDPAPPSNQDLDAIDRYLQRTITRDAAH